MMDVFLSFLLDLEQLCDLYENDSIFDKFECCLSGDGLRVATGSYRYMLYILVIVLIILNKTSTICQDRDIIYVFSVIAAICFGCLVVLKVVQKLQHWKPAKTH